jgi:hypothetical protein
VHPFTTEIEPGAAAQQIRAMQRKAIVSVCIIEDVGALAMTPDAGSAMCRTACFDVSITGTPSPATTSPLVAIAMMVPAASVLASIIRRAQIEFWNSAATRAWADQYARMDRAVAALTKEMLDLAAPQPGERVLDIGCGPGTTVLELAKHVGPGGHVLAQMSPSHRSPGRANGSQLPACGTRRSSSRMLRSILSRLTASS